MITMNYIMFGIDDKKLGCIRSTKSVMRELGKTLAAMIRAVIIRTVDP